MDREELKKRLQQLDELLANTNSNLKIDVAKSKTAQKELLSKYRVYFITGFLIAIVCAIMIIFGIGPSKFTLQLNIEFLVLSLLYAIWNTYLFIFLKRIDITTMTPYVLFARTTKLKLMMLSGDVIYGLFIVVVIVTQCLSKSEVWFYITVSFVVCIYSYIRIHLPRYKKLFHDLNSIKE